MSRWSTPVLVVVPDRRLRRVLRHGLAERGHQAAGLASLGELLAFVRGEAVGMILIDLAALGPWDMPVLDLVRIHCPDAPIVLMARATASWPPGPWNAILCAPTSADDVVATVEWLLPLSPRVEELAMS